MVVVVVPTIVVVVVRTILLDTTGGKYWDDVTALTSHSGATPGEGQRTWTGGGQLVPTVREQHLIISSITA